MADDETGEVAATAPGEPIVDRVPRSLHDRGTKRKVSLTIDESLLEEVRALAGDRPVSAVVNELLAGALSQHRLNELVDEMIAEAGQPPPEVYAEIADEWDRAAKR